MIIEDKMKSKFYAKLNEDHTPHLLKQSLKAVCEYNYRKSWRKESNLNPAGNMVNLESSMF